MVDMNADVNLIVACEHGNRVMGGMTYFGPYTTLRAEFFRPE